MTIKCIALAFFSYHYHHLIIILLLMPSELEHIYQPFLSLRSSIIIGLFGKIKDGRLHIAVFLWQGRLRSSLIKYYLAIRHYPLVQDLDEASSLMQ